RRTSLQPGSTLAAAPMRAAGRDDPDFEIAGGETGRRLEQDRRVGVAGQDQRVERGAGSGLLWVKGRRADTDRVYRSRHQRTSISAENAKGTQRTRTNWRS